VLLDVGCGVDVCWGVDVVTGAGGDGEVVVAAVVIPATSVGEGSCACATPFVGDGRTAGALWLGAGVEVWGGVGCASLDA
jgi:hypothetical protein